MRHSEIPAVIESVDTFKKHIIELMEECVQYKDIKPMLGGMGVYQQRQPGQFMLRVRIPGGILNAENFRHIYEVGSQVQGVRFHFSTRQDIQLHDLSASQLIDVMEGLLKRGLVTTGGGGNYPRNIACSVLTGVSKEEVFDVEPYVSAVADYIMQTIDTFILPRKYKVGFSNTHQDEANATITDVGFIAQKEGDEESFRVLVGGGCGRNPRPSILYKEKVAPDDVLYIIEAVKNLFHDEGNFENRNKARLRYIVERMGEEAFLEKLDEYVAKVKEEKAYELHITPITHDKKGNKTDVEDSRLIKQKQDGLYAVYIHPAGGFMIAEETKKLLELVEGAPGSSLRLTMGQGAYIIDLTGEEAERILEETEALGFGCRIASIVACVGSTTCQIGLSPSQELMKLINNVFVHEDISLLQDLPRIHISGCPSSCAMHQIVPIGFYGGKKRVDGEMKDAFTLCVGGNRSAEGVKMAEEVGQMVMEKIPAFVYQLARDLKAGNVKLEKEQILNKYEPFFA